MGMWPKAAGMADPALPEQNCFVDFVCALSIMAVMVIAPLLQV
jgi:hypothetical protein